MKARNNPFSSEKIEKLPFRFNDLTMEDILHRLEDLHYRGAIIGPQGSGKTSLLEQIEPELWHLGFQTKWIRLRRDDCPLWPHNFKAVIDHVSPNEIILFDGAELLAPLEWWGFHRRMRSAGGLIITAHREGRLPVAYRCRPTLKVLRGLVEELSPEEKDIPEYRTDALFLKHHGNIREALRELYDKYSHRDAI